MKRIALSCLGLALALSSTAHAQALSMQMSNGWKFAFSGNVNAFYFYNAGSTEGGIAGSLVPTGDRSSIGTGLLPAFATFEAMGREGGLDLGVHFGFAPQVNMGNGAASTFGPQAAGAQIDMRQAFLTFGDKSWGQILAGKELGLFQRQNILTDMTLFGAGTGGGGRGTALGRIGFGYLYTDFRGQITYSTPAGKPFSLAVGVFEPTHLDQYDITKTPRLEAEAQYKSGNFHVWASGMVQNAEAAAKLANGDDAVTATGGSAGVKLTFGGFSLVGSGFIAKGLGTVFQGDVNTGDAGNANVLGFDTRGNARDTKGYLAQATFTPTNSKITLGASYGRNQADLTSYEEGLTGTAATNLRNGLLKYNSSIVGLFSYQMTKSLRWVTEYTYSEAKNQSGTLKDSSSQFGTGFMLFF